MKTILKTMFLTALGFTISTAYSQDNNSVDKANNKVDKAQNKLDKAEDNAKDVYEREWKEFKKETETKIDNNEKRIKELRRHKTSEPSMQESYNKKIDKLEAENDRLKKDLKDYDYNGKDDWQRFKNDVTTRMDRVGDAIDVATE